MKTADYSSEVNNNL